MAKETLVKALFTLDKASKTAPSNPEYGKLIKKAEYLFGKFVGELVVDPVGQTTVLKDVKKLIELLED